MANLSIMEGSLTRQSISETCWKCEGWKHEIVEIKLKMLQMHGTPWAPVKVKITLQAQRRRPQSRFRYQSSLRQQTPCKDPWSRHKQDTCACSKGCFNFLIKSFSPPFVKVRHGSVPAAVFCSSFTKSEGAATKMVLSEQFSQLSWAKNEKYVFFWLRSHLAWTSVKSTNESRWVKAYNVYSKA